MAQRRAIIKRGEKGRRMRAVAYSKALPISEPDCLIDVTLDRPEPTGFDLLVEVKAVSVNPVDVKRRGRDNPGETLRVLGYDAAGIVVETGSQTSRFRVGDEVFYAGAFGRPGTNCEFHLVDERIVGRKPTTLGWAEAAALPLTALTAYELIFERIGVRRGVGADTRAILMIGGAGGVGSIAIQLARRLAGLKVIATASRQETHDWCLEMGAHHVIDHSLPLTPQIEALNMRYVDIALGLNASSRHLPEIAKLIAPLGHIGLIDDAKNVDFGVLKSKGVSIHWEFMFTRSTFATPDMARQGQILDEVAGWIDEGRLRSTLREIVGPIDAAHLREAHRRLESGHTCGKIGLEGFPVSHHLV
jgi:zinc-binding alcohol dehydrogenase family protein